VAANLQLPKHVKFIVPNYIKSALKNIS